MGGIIAGYYGARHPEAAVVSIVGFAAGTLPHHSPEEAEEFAAWATATRMGLERMTAPPETGDAAWMEEQVTRFLVLFDQLSMGQLNLRRRLGDSSSHWAAVAFGGTQPGVFSTTNSRMPRAA